MRKKFILLIFLLFLLIPIEKDVHAAEKSCSYSRIIDINKFVDVTIKIENETLNYTVFESTGAITSEVEDYIGAEKFESSCPSSIYYRDYVTSSISGVEYKKYTFHDNSDSNTRFELKFKESSGFSKNEDDNENPDDDNSENDDEDNSDNNDDNSGSKIEVDDSFFGNLDVVKCGNMEIPAPVPAIIRTIIKLIKVATPLVVIIMGMIDILKAVIASDEKKLKESQAMFIKRLIPAAIIFLVVTIIQFVVNFIADDRQSLTNCLNCMINNSKSCIKVDRDNNKDPEAPNDPSGNSSSSNKKTTSYIQSIKKDGVIVTIKTKNLSGIKGYYFSYNSTRPKNKQDGYIETNKNSIDVVRLPGKTYVWVEDSKGKISKSKTITISNDEILITKGNEYTILKGTALSTYLSNKGWSMDGLNNLMARSVRAAGLYSKEAAATSAITLTHVLAQKYKIKLPYESAGLYTKVGADPAWGSERFNYIEDKTVYGGLDCSAFVNWAYANAGYGINKRAYFWGNMPRVDFNKNNGDVGDILVFGHGEQEGRHVKLIIGKTKTAFITAEASGSPGIVITLHEYSKPNNYKIQKAINLTDLTKNTGYYKLTDYPSGI